MTPRRIVRQLAAFTVRLHGIAARVAGDRQAAGDVARLTRDLHQLKLQVEKAAARKGAR